MAHALEAQIRANSKHNNEQTQREDIITPLRVLPLRVVPLDECVRSLDSGLTSQRDKCVITVELGHRQALDGIVQRVEPVHEDPEVREVLGADEEACEE